MSSILLFGNLIVWLTPIWILSVGVTIGMAILLVLFGLLWLVARPAAESVARVVRESVLLPITYMAIVFVGFCLLGAPTMPARLTIDSLKRLTSVGPQEKSVTIPAGEEDFAVPIEFRAERDSALRIREQSKPRDQHESRRRLRGSFGADSGG